MKQIQNLNIQTLVEENIIREVYLFGSVARKDDDEFSDIDILIVINECNENEYIKYKKNFSRILQIPIEWISLYRFSKIEKMQQKGSYFLWHIKKEGIKLFSRYGELESLLKILPRYNYIEEDLNEYNQILNDIENELDNNEISINYELSVLASLVRNTCIALAYINNRFDFGRKSVIITCKDIYKEKIEFSLEEYEELYTYRLNQTGKILYVKDSNIEFLIKWIEYEKKLLKIALKGVEYYGK